MSVAHQRIIGKIAKHKELFDLDKNGLGESLMDLAVTVMLETMDREVGLDGTPWPPLSELYAKWKSKVAPGKPMAVLFEHMKTREQLSGQRRITPREAIMEYGVDELAIDLAHWFQEGSAKQNRPPRLFYGLSAETLQRSDQLCNKHVYANLK